MTTSQDTIDRVVRITADALHVSSDTITSATTWVDDLGMDSLAQAELLLALEEEFKIEIRDDETEFLPTVGELATYIEGKTVS